MASFADIFNMPVGQGGITWAQLLGIAGQQGGTPQAAQGMQPQGQQPQAQAHGQPTFSFQDFFTPASGQPLLYNTAPTTVAPRPQRKQMNMFDWLNQAAVQGGNEGGTPADSPATSGGEDTGDSGW